MPSPLRRVVLFAREPVSGRVKTRLAREVGPEAARDLYAAFLRDLAEALPDPARWDAFLAHAEPEAGPFLRSTFRAPWTLVPQGEGSLGERLESAFESAVAGGAAHVVVAGSDAPTLCRADLEAAFRALDDGAEVVFAPSPDGGFSLVGARLAGETAGRAGDTGDFFEGVRWSTAHALEDCRSAAERRGLRVRLLAALPDVDVRSDVEALARDLSKYPNSRSTSFTRRAVAAVLAGSRT